MKTLKIPLLMTVMLLGACHPVAVRTTLEVPIGVVEHRHMHDAVVVVHSHRTIEHETHHHARPDYPRERRVVVIPPSPRVSLPHRPRIVPHTVESRADGHRSRYAREAERREGAHHQQRGSRVTPPHTGKSPRADETTREWPPRRSAESRSEQHALQHERGRSDVVAEESRQERGRRQAERTGTHTGNSDRRESFKRERQPREVSQEGDG